MARRLKALELAQATEQERRRREEEEERRRIEELERARREREEREREEREREERRRQEEEAARLAEEAARKKAEEDRARAEARAAKMSGAGAAEKPRGPLGLRRDRDSGDSRGPRATKGDSRRSSGKLTINQALAGGDESGRQRSLAAIRRKQERERQKAMGGSQRAEKQSREVHLPDTITVQELANRMAERAADVVKALMKMGMMATMNQTIDAETAELIDRGIRPPVVAGSEADVEGDRDRRGPPEDLKPRPRWSP
ncbi:MAG: hypothetical protein KatS3mg118_0509 [Paracoccaceae bacterium]|nr:MAG: hypothetical protein KatS3mg118_0509 [Paracoccaceae bacterium]